MLKYINLETLVLFQSPKTAFDMHKETGRSYPNCHWEIKALLRKGLICPLPPVPTVKKIMKQPYCLSNLGKELLKYVRYEANKGTFKRIYIKSIETLQNIEYVKSIEEENSSLVISKEELMRKGVKVER